MKRSRLAGALLLALAARAGAFTFNAAGRGTTSADFLNLGVGARAVGMGGAYSSVANDATALYWNPAGLSRINNRSFTFMHASYIDSSFFDYAAYGQDLGRYGAVGAGVQYFSAGDIAQTDPSGALLGSFSPYDVAVSFGYAYAIPRAEFMSDLTGFTVGAAVKYVQSQIIANAGTAALDLGLLTPAYVSGRLRWAFTATNIGGKLRYEQKSAELPAALRFGVSYKVSKDLLVATDLVAPSNDNVHVALGTEYWMASSGPWKFAARAGFDSQTVSSGVGGLTGLSLGFGLGHERTSFDYAFVPYGGLGQAHRISLTVGF